jgi:hypothetical protein
MMLALLGVVSIVIQLFNLELRVLRWLSEMAPAGAWGIRIGLIVVGALLAWWGLAKTKAEEAVEAEAEAENRKAAEAAGLDAGTDPYVVQCRTDPRFAELMDQVQDKHEVHEGSTVEAERYRIRSAAFIGQNGLRVDPDSGEAGWVVVYLERQNAPKRIQISLDLKTQELKELPLSGMQWSSLVS